MRARASRLAGVPRVRVFYDETCPPCRTLSRLVVVLSLGAMARVPLGSEEAARLHRRHPEWTGQLLLLDGGEAWLGPRVFAAVPRKILQVYGRLLARPFRILANLITRRSRS